MQWSDGLANGRISLSHEQNHRATWEDWEEKFVLLCTNGIRLTAQLVHFRNQSHGAASSRRIRKDEPKLTGSSTQLINEDTKTDKTRKNTNTKDTHTQTKERTGIKTTQSRVSREVVALECIKAPSRVVTAGKECFGFQSYSAHDDGLGRIRPEASCSMLQAAREVGASEISRVSLGLFGAVRWCPRTTSVSPAT